MHGLAPILLYLLRCGYRIGNKPATMKKILLLLFVFGLFAGAYGQGFGAEKVRLPGLSLENLYRIDSGVYRSDQPTRADFAVLTGYGMTEVLNLRHFHSDGPEAEGTPLVLHRIRSHAHSIDSAQLVEAMRIIRDRKGPILIHCWHGSDRTGAVVALYRMVFQHVPREQAIREMTGGGFGFHRIFGHIVDTLRKIDIEAVRRELGI